MKNYYPYIIILLQAVFIFAVSVYYLIERFSYLKEISSQEFQGILYQIQSACNFTGLIGSIITILGTGSIASFITYILLKIQKSSYKNLWKINDKDFNKLYIYISSRQDTSQANIINNFHTITTVGIGQVTALSYILNSINKAYQDNIEPEQIRTSENRDRNIGSKHLLILGGPLTNHYTREFLNRIKTNKFDLEIPEDDSYRSIIFNKNDNKYRVNKEDYHKKDYSIIVYTNNIFSSYNHIKNRKLYLFFGLQTYGTNASARYFVDDFYNEFIKYRFFKNIWLSLTGKSSKKIKDNIIAIISCKVTNKSTTNIKLVDYVTFSNNEITNFFD